MEPTIVRTDNLNDFWKSGVVPAIQTAAKAVDDKLGGCVLSQTGSDFYIDGAGGARKKLGEVLVDNSTLTKSPYDGSIGISGAILEKIYSAAQGKGLSFSQNADGSLRAEWSEAGALDETYGFIEHNDILSSTQRIEYTDANKYFNPITVTMGGGYSLGDWANFPLLVDNKPYMVHSDGTPDYQLDEMHYDKKLDGSPSDAENTAYDGGCFSWIRKIYKQEYMDGTKRVVKFRFKPAPDFAPIGFIDPQGRELEGAWLPMCYGATVGGKTKSIFGTQPDINKNTDQQNTGIKANGNNAHFFGGGLLNTIVDLLIMFAKNTNSQAAYGNGNSGGYVNEMPYYGAKPNQIVGGGQFYGTSDSKSLNKILHSLVLGSYNQWIRDPYLYLVNGRAKISRNYAYDINANGYEDAGIVYAASDNGVWPSTYRTISGFGAVPVAPHKGSSTTGGCDRLWVYASGTMCSLRFGGPGDGAGAGCLALHLYSSPGRATWLFGCAVLLLPPVGVAAGGSGGAL